MRRSASEKLEIIRIVQDSELGVKRTLEELGINRSTFYEWYRKYLESGFEGLKQKSTNRNSFWNKIPDKERKEVVELALDKPELSPRELACFITDNHKWFISESSVYRILKSRGLITSPAWIVMAASDEFKDKTSYVHQQWQTDFTYFKIIGWGWYYLATIMDDYSRYIITWELCKNMETEDAKRVVGQAIRETGVEPPMRPRLLTDNGSCYISQEFKKFITDEKMGHVKGAPYHPQTQGKIERYHRTMKNIVKLENYFFPEELRMRLGEFVTYYNNDRYHESLGNLTPADVYFGRDRQRHLERMDIKMKTLKERRVINRRILA
jgi:transposase InsO family protein/transposase-like protein